MLENSALQKSVVVITTNIIRHFSIGTHCPPLHKKLNTRNQSPTKSRTPTERQARAQELCDSRGGRPGLPYLILISLRFLWTTLNQPETGQNQSRCRHTHTHLSDGAFSLQTILSGRHVRFSE